MFCIFIANTFVLKEKNSTKVRLITTWYSTGGDHSFSPPPSPPSSHTGQLCGLPLPLLALFLIPRATCPPVGTTMVYVRAVAVWIRDMRTPPEEIAAAEKERLAKVRCVLVCSSFYPYPMDAFFFCVRLMCSAGLGGRPLRAQVLLTMSCLLAVWSPSFLSVASFFGGGERRLPSALLTPPPVPPGSLH